MIQIKNAATFARMHRLLLIKNLHFIDTFSWKDHLTSGKKTLLVISHGPPFGPILYLSAMIPYFDDNGCGDISFSIIPHPILHRLPVTFNACSLPAGFKRRYSVVDYVSAFKDDNLDALVVAPEGEYCLYGNGIDIQPFRSPRSIEIALKADCEIVLSVASGFESWQKNIDIKSPFRRLLVKTLGFPPPRLFIVDEEHFEKAETFSMQLPPRRIKDFYVYSKFYKPLLKADDLSDDEDIKIKQLWTEAERMREEMQKMADELKE